jgi:shikimate kinase
LIALDSRLTNMEMDYVELKNQLERHWFVLGGNWEYSQGSFDRRLDGEKQTVWLRIPFDVVHGRLDPDQANPDTRVRIGTPYVLRHLYHEGDDHTAQFYVLGALVDQFQKPTDPDADVPSSYELDAEDLLAQIEAVLI